MWLDSQSQHPLARLHLPQGRGRFFFVGHLGGAVWLELHFHGEQSVFTLIGFILWWF